MDTSEKGMVRSAKLKKLKACSFFGARTDTSTRTTRTVGPWSFAGSRCDHLQLSAHPMCSFHGIDLGAGGLPTFA